MKNLIKKCIIVLLIISTSSSYSNDLLIDKILPVMKLMESNGDVTAIGDGGAAYGILQIHKVCVDDVNKTYGTSYTHEDMFNETCSEEVFSLYLKKGTSLMIRKNEVISEQDLVRMWNGGIYTGHTRSTTEKYWKYYNRMRKVYVKSLKSTFKFRECNHIKPCNICKTAINYVAL